VSEIISFARKPIKEIFEKIPTLKMYTSLRNVLRKPSKLRPGVLLPPGTSSICYPEILSTKLHVISKGFVGPTEDSWLPPMVTSGSPDQHDFFKF
jgi:hypothetical protein